MDHQEKYVCDTRRNQWYHQICSEGAWKVLLVYSIQLVIHSFNQENNRLIIIIQVHKMTEMSLSYKWNWASTRNPVGVDSLWLIDLIACFVFINCPTDIYSASTYNNWNVIILLYVII